MVVVFEGFDTSGKTSLITGVCQRKPVDFVPISDISVDKLVSAATTFEPFGIDVTNPDTIQLLYCAIVMGTELEIEYAVREGKIPLVDRYIDTLIVYADLFQNYRRPVQTHREIARLIGKDLRPVPDLTFFVDIDYETIVTRLSSRKEVGMLERFSPDTYKAIRAGFFKQMAESGRRYAIVPKGLSLDHAIDFCYETILRFL